MYPKISLDHPGGEFMGYMDDNLQQEHRAFYIKKFIKQRNKDKKKLRSIYRVQVDGADEDSQ